MTEQSEITNTEEFLNTDYFINRGMLKYNKKNELVLTYKGKLIAFFYGICSIYAFIKYKVIRIWNKLLKR